MNNVMPVTIVVMIICVRLEFRNTQILLESVAFRFCIAVWNARVRVCSMRSSTFRCRLFRIT